MHRSKFLVLTSILEIQSDSDHDVSKGSMAFQNKNQNVVPLLSVAVMCNLLMRRYIVYILAPVKDMSNMKDETIMVAVCMWLCCLLDFLQIKDEGTPMSSMPWLGSPEKKEY